MTSVYSPELTTTADYWGGGPSTDWQPLLTVFTPPSHCPSQWFYDPRAPGTVRSDSSYNPQWSACQPYENAIGQYSPGICPSGQEFKEVTKSLQSTTSVTTDTYYDGVCCSDSFTWSYPLITATRSDGSVFSQSLDGFCVSSFEPPFTALLVGDDEGSETVLDSMVIALGGYVHMQWHETDLSSFTQSLAASLRAGMGLPAYPSTIASSTAASSGPSQPTATDTSNSDAGATVYLSRGAIAGISIGVATVFLIIATLAYLAFARRWKKNNSNHHQSPDTYPHDSPGPSHRFSRMSWITRWRKDADTSPDTSDTTRPDMAEMDQGDNVYKAFSGGAWRAELGGSHGHGHGHSRNLSDGTTRSELPGSHTHQSLHSRNPSDGSQVDPRVSYYSGSTAIGPVMELEGSAPVRREVIHETHEG